MHEQVTGAKLPPVGALAYLGDGVHSLYIRKMLVKSGISRPGDLSRTALAYITAERQADAFRRIENHLLPDELDVARRAQNNTHLNKPKHATHSDYHAATALEAVLGMLSLLGDDERIDLLMKLAYDKETKDDTEN